MKIAIFGGAEYTIPPPNKGIFPALSLVNLLTEGLVEKGHQVTLFAPTGSHSSAQVTDFNQSPLDELRLDRKVEWEVKGLIAYEQVMLSQIYRQLQNDKYDVFHSHDPLRTLPMVGLADLPTVFTMHTPVAPSYQLAYEAARHAGNRFYPVSISQAQQRLAESIGWFDTVYNGIDLTNFPFSEQAGEELLWIGRVHPDKGTDVAIDLARQLNLTLSLVGRHVAEDKVSAKFWEEKIRPEIDGHKIKHLGLVPPNQIAKIYQNAKVFVFPIQWEEPFGLVVAEAMACGTPVVTFERGSMPELVKDGETGYVVKPGDNNAMAEAIKKIYDLPPTDYRQLRQRCRQQVEQKFSLATMIDRYEQVYQRAIHQR